jgi:hypothetical protein
MQQRSFEHLHENIFLEISMYLAYKEIGKCLLICQSWTSLINLSPQIWKKMYQNMFYQHCSELLPDRFDDHVFRYRQLHYVQSLPENEEGMNENEDEGNTSAVRKRDFFYHQFNSHFPSALKFHSSFNWKEKFLMTQFLVQNYFRKPHIPTTEGDVVPDLDFSHLQEQHLLKVQRLPVNPDDNQLVPRGGHTCHVLKHQNEDYLIILGGDIPIDFGELSTLDIIHLRTGEIVFNNHYLLPSMMTSTWLNCSVKVNNKIYLVQYSHHCTHVMKIGLTNKKRFIESKMLTDRDYNNSSTNSSLSKPNKPIRGSGIVLDPIPVPSSSTTTGLSTSNPALLSPGNKNRNNNNPSPSAMSTSTNNSSSSMPNIGGTSSRHRCILFGGEFDTSHIEQDELTQLDPSTRYLNDVFALHIDESRPDIIEWQKIITTGEKPCPRAAHSMILVDRSLYVFGGWTNIQTFEHHFQSASQQEGTRKKQGATIVADDVFLNDLYVLNIDFFHWKKVETFGIPPVPRCQTVLFSMPSFLKYYLNDKMNNTAGENSGSGGCYSSTPRKRSLLSPLFAGSCNSKRTMNLDLEMDFV